MVEDPNRAIQNRVFALLRLAVRERGRGFLHRASDPDQRILDRTIQRLREDEVPGPITEGGVLHALLVAAAVLHKPPARR